MLAKKLIGTGGLVTALVLLLGINTISNNSMRGARLDLTENKLYTLTDGSKNIVRELPDPITLRFFYSEKIGNGVPQINSYATRVRELLEEYVAVSNGKLKLEVIDPEPFSEAEERAVQAGMQGAPLSRSESLYFGLEAVDTTDQQKTISFFNQEREQFLEYDISQLIYNVAHPKKRKVVVLSPLPVNGEDVDPMARMMGRAQGGDPWVIIQSLRELYDVEVIDNKVEELPAEMDALLLVHPKELSDKLLYQIDQYVLKGGKTAVFVDPHAEVDQPPSNPQNPMQSMMAPRGSDLPTLFKSWGIELVSGKVVGDRDRAIEVPTGNQARPKIVPFVVYQALTQDDVNKDETITSQLNRLQLAMPGALRKIEGGTTTVTPLLESSSESELIDVDKVRMFPDPEEMLKNFTSLKTKQILAARVSGVVKTAYPTGVEGTKDPNHLDESKEPINVFVFADVDMLTDRLWVQTQRFLGQTVRIPMAQNGDMVINTVDLLSGSDDLIAIRSRGKFNRPFERVEQIRKDAEERFSARMKELQDKLEQTEKELADLQKERGDSGSGALLLTDEQRAKIEQFQEERLKTRKELRGVELALRQDIEKLGTKMKLLNIGLMPLLVGVLAVGLGFMRSHRRRRR
ncbi:gliding motility protein GldG [bacterium]|nr:gliding motility protein GldG [bacterium]